MESRPISVSMDFQCSAQSVWGVLTNTSLYFQWNPRRGEGDSHFEDASFALGAKITSDGDQTTGVVSQMQNNARFTVLYGQRHETVLLSGSGAVCRVTMEVEDTDADSDALTEWADRALLSLKELVYQNLADTDIAAAGIIPVKRHRRMRNILSGILQGYRNPLKPSATLMDDSDQMADLIDHTEGDVIIHLRAALVALMCTVFLFVTIFYALRFPRSEVIPSTGMSLYESDDVNKLNAFQIVIGMYKSDLELMTNCLGRQLSINEYSYASTSRTPGGRPSYQMIISYDAYSRVRTVRFLDNSAAATPLELHLSDLRPILSSAMTAQQIEEAVDYPLSAFILDISGVTRVFFGVVECNDYFGSMQGILSSLDLSTRSELVIETERHRDTIGIEYNYPYDPHNTLPYNEITDKLRRQYSNYLTNYRNDRAAYERIFFLYAKTQDEVEMLIGPAEGYTIGDDLTDTGFYPLASADSGYERYYVYEVSYSSNRIVTGVAIRNRLLENKANTLLETEQYAFREGMSLFEFYAEIGVLPSYAKITADSLSLAYGEYVHQQVYPMNGYEMYFRFAAGADPLQLSDYRLEMFRFS